MSRPEGQIYSIDGVVPVVDPSAFVHPMAVLIGDVVVGPRCYVGPGAALRGDVGRIVLGEGANIQDNCVLHCFPGRDTVVETDGHIGHGAILHGCRIGADAMVGMAAVVMDGAEIGAGAFVAALAFVKAGMKVPPRNLVAGIPAKVVREINDEEFAWKQVGTRGYHAIAARSLATMKRVAPLAALEADRPKLRVEIIAPKFETKRG
ncbi:MAG: phenylacetic acid degradation protein PaaY [Alphaproteobacteria bacterium]|nr:phenylacetic acid degradation protein PaaY [Alphaproteobacteria bacterium]